MTTLEPLPRGRHKLDPAVVRASQRERLLIAMGQCVGEQGYAATTVPQVTARARVSRTAFYEHFRDKEDCFVAVFDDHSDDLLDQLMSLAQTPDWIAALSTGMERYLRWWQERPGYCRCFFVELAAAGPRALDARDRAFARFADMFGALAAWARLSDPGLPPLAPHNVALLTYGVTELIAQEWRAGRADRLTGLHRALMAHAITLLADERTARDALA